MKTPALAMSLLLLAFANCSYAQFRCGPYLVEIGEFKADVLDKCGPPAAQARFPGSHGHLYYDFGDTPQHNPEDQGYVEEWVYNFGPNRFKQYLRFENGQLQETRTLGYGRW
jgi:hypothetical protein